MTDIPANPFAESFAEYHAKGWSGTLPLPYAAKKLPPREFTGYEGAYPSFADLHTWADDGPRNICQRMRADVVGVDVDAYNGKPGAATLATLVQAFGALPPSWMSTSRDDGISGIRYYRVPVGTTLIGSLPGIEFIQRHHRYAVVWPSVHPDTGQVYQWVNELTGEIGCDIPAVADLPELPSPWLAGLRNDASGSTKADHTLEQMQGTLHGFPHGAPCHHVLKAAGRALEGTSRHDSYNAAVLAVCRHGRQGCPGAQTVIARLRAAFISEISAPGERATVGEAEAEWKRCLHGALAIVVDEDQGTACIDTATVDWINSAVATQEPQDESEPPQRTSWWPRDLSGVLSGDDPEPAPEFLHRLDGVPLFYRGKVNGLIGESESGKTWVALLCVLQCLQASTRVLYLDFEDTAPGIVTRLRLMGATDADLAHLAYIGPDEALSLQAKADLSEAVQATPPDLIVLDGFNAAMTLLGLELTDNTDATRFSQWLLKPLASTGACVVYVDHVPKNKDARGKGGIGAQAKRAMTTGCALAVDVLEPFGRGMTGRLRLTVDKDRPGHVRAASIGASKAGEAVLTSKDNGSVVVEIETSLSEEEIVSAVEEAARSRIVRTVAGFGSGGCSRREIATAMGVKQDTNRPHIDYLVKRRILIEDPTKTRAGHPLLVVNSDPDQELWDL